MDRKNLIQSKLSFKRVRESTDQIGGHEVESEQIPTSSKNSEPKRQKQFDELELETSSENESNDEFVDEQNVEIRAGISKKHFCNMFFNP